MQRLSTLPEQQWLAPAVLVLVCAMGLTWIAARVCWPRRARTRVAHGLTSPRHLLGVGFSLALGLSVGAASAVWRAQLRVDDGLAWRHRDQVSRLVVRIADLPQRDDRRQRFMADVLEPRPAGIPSRIAVSWAGQSSARLPGLKPGQRWRMALVLRQPHGARNPHGHDAEGRAFAQGIRATATVRGVPRLLGDEPFINPGILIERVRHWVREGMQQALGERRYAPVLIALAMGDQAAVARDDWQVFNRSGITHLVSISGMHVTLIAAMGGMLAMFLWRRGRWRHTRLAEYLPAQVVGAGVALWVALLYCLLAGWGVPARRTFFMLAVVALAAMVRLPLSASRVLALAGAAVCLLDPWATLAPGFWLSFGAVAVLLRIGASIESGGRGERTGWRTRLRTVLVEFGYVQTAITLALVPLLAYLMHQVSLASPLINAYAIPVVSFLVTPLALVCALLGGVPGLKWLAQGAGVLGHAVFEAMMAPVSWMSASSWAVLDVAAAPWPWMVLALFGVAWAIQPRGLPWRAAGWLLMLPMLCWRPERPASGYWTLTALDVGQGSAIVIETATQVWLFDTGPVSRQGVDAGTRVVVPFLRARGYRSLNGLIVSHADMDHAGGLNGILNSVPVGQAYASFDLPELLRGKRMRDMTSAQVSTARMPRSMQSCAAGQAWDIDGVQFSFLHPDARVTADGPGNARSCVLMIRGKAHTALLPGDIGIAQERRLAPDLPTIDVVLAPHHGSTTSSGSALVRAVEAKHVIAQVGHMNRFGHPAPTVQARWRAAGAHFWRTDQHGAVVVRSERRGLGVEACARATHRYWHRAAELR